MENLSINKLNHFLRGELSAVEAYADAITKLKDDAARSQVQQCEESHRSRAVLLRERIQHLGGEPSASSGPEGAFARIAEAAASLFGDKAIINALEQGEDKGLRDYKQQLPDLEAEAVEGIADRLLAEQQRTHELMSQLQTSAR